MHQVKPELRTADALAMAGLTPKAWDNLVSRGLFSEAPPTTTTHARKFGVDDVVALFAIRHYLDLGTGPAMAGRVGAAVRKELAKAGPGQEFFWIASTAEGTPCKVVLTRPPDDIASTQFPLATMRRTIGEAVSAKLAEQGR